MKVWIVAIAGALVAGCGVSKELYQVQVFRSQEMEARSADLGARLEGETARRKSAEQALAEKKVEAEALRRALAETEARAGDGGARLQACGEREAGARADLDLCRRDRTAGEAARAEEREKLRAEVRDWQARARDAQARVADGQTRLEDAQARVEDAEARVAALREQTARVEAEKRETVDEIAKTYEGLLLGMKEEVDQGRVTISQLQGKLSVNVLDEILFDSGRADVKPAGREVLGRLAEVLKGLADQTIVIEGHTDDIPIAGELAKRFPTNWELSAARATSVVRFLEETAGVTPARLSAVGMGPHRPVAPNDTPEGRAKNRRIEVKLVPIEAPLFGRPEEPPAR